MGWKTNLKKKTTPCVFCILSEGFTKERPQSWFVFGSFLSLSISTISSPFSGAPCGISAQRYGPKKMSDQCEFISPRPREPLAACAQHAEDKVRLKTSGSGNPGRIDSLWCAAQLESLIVGREKKKKTPDTKIVSAEDCFKASSPLWGYTKRKRWPSYSDKKFLPEFLPCTRGGSARFHGLLPLILTTSS